MQAKVNHLQKVTTTYTEYSAQNHVFSQICFCGFCFENKLNTFQYYFKEALKLSLK